MTHKYPAPFNILLFDGFTLLDAFGPGEIIGNMDLYHLAFLSMGGGKVRSAQGLEVYTDSVLSARWGGVLLLPGGPGTRPLAQDESFLEQLGHCAALADTLLSVCTGAALLARAGLLSGRRATSNKTAWNWVTAQDDRVNWARRARWVWDAGNVDSPDPMGRKDIYTSSGVSAGMDMVLGFLSDRHGALAARNIARHIEYIWNDDPDEDPFA